MKIKIISPILYRGKRSRIGETLEMNSADAELLLASDNPIIEVVSAAALNGNGAESDTEPQIFESETPIDDPVLDLDEAAPDEDPEEAPAGDHGKTNLNTAPLEEVVSAFAKVRGIGEGSARAVVENRPYESLEEVPDKAALSGAVAAKWVEVMPFLTV